MLEKNMRFSRSVLWQYQMQYFADQGIKAWQGQVPFFVTSNPNIGISYAKVMFGYIKDMVEQKNYRPEQPFYILELGTGAGKFSFYCLQKLSELVEFEFGGAVKICYIMSDFTMSNISFWQQQPQLKRYLAAGSLDFACVDMTKFTEIELIHSGKVLATPDFVNGLMVVGNYIFDTVPHDSFAIQDGRLFEARSDVETIARNIENKKPKDLEKLEVTFKKSLVKKHYADYDPALVQVLEEYKQQLQDTNVLIPISGIQTLEKLAELTNNKMLLISTDKGMTDLTELEGRSMPHVAFHGSFSMMVNFHAMTRYNEIKGGSSALQPCHSGIKTVVLTRGIKLEDYRWLTRNIAQYIQDASPAQFFHMHRYLRHNPISYGLEVMIPYLINSHWDPYVFVLLHKNLLHRLPELAKRHLKILDAGMAKIADKIFDMPGDNDPWLLIGHYFFARDNFSEVVKYSQLSIERKGAGSYNLMLLGSAYIGLKEYSQAIKYLQQSRDMGADPINIDKLLKQAQSGLV